MYLLTLSKLNNFFLLVWTVDR